MCDKLGTSFVGLVIMSDRKHFIVTQICMFMWPFVIFSHTNRGLFLS
jgi:hypothetical protein